MASEKRLIQQIKKQHGSVIDLDKSPSTMIEILRRFRFEIDESPDGGLPPGGTPPSPPGPSSIASKVTLEEVMREVLKLSRQVSKIKKQVGPG